MDSSVIRLVGLVAVVILSGSRAHGEEEKKGGWIRERIKARILKKIEDKPAPTASTDVTTKIEKPGDFTYKISVGGRDRYYIVHVPKSYSPKTAAPLLIVLHGGGGNMTIQANDGFYKQISKSEQTGSIAVFPNGISKFKSGDLATWNAGGCCANARDEKVDDVGFIRQVVKNVSALLSIDSKRVFATGMSNGGMMAYRLACEASDVFSAIAAVAGTDNTTSCEPKKPISILHIHAKDDDRVLYGGGAGKPFADNEAAVTNFVSVAASIAKWTKLEGCDAATKRVLEKPGAVCDRYVKCGHQVAVQLCVTDEGGHSWPGGKKPRGNGNPSQALSANDVMWDFFNEVVPR